MSTMPVGRWSLDHLLGLLPWPLWASLAAVVIGPGSGLITRSLLRRAPAAGDTTDDKDTACASC
ncbi:hypothetical protein [Streptomyces sp. NPDC048737]|uniref:hypothetical protein n=1 Tax=unclassified Streptomyces TaxID=2593676 RepID=UPI00344370FF